jgi:IS1 family transposase
MKLIELILVLQLVAFLTLMANPAKADLTNTVTAMNEVITPIIERDGDGDVYRVVSSSVVARGTCELSFETSTSSPNGPAFYKRNYIHLKDLDLLYVEVPGRDEYDAYERRVDYILISKESRQFRTYHYDRSHSGAEWVQRTDLETSSGIGANFHFGARSYQSARRVISLLRQAAIQCGA